MYRINYQKKYKKLNISKNQKSNILAAYDIILNEKINVNNEEEIDLLEYALFVFNDLYHFIEGGADSKDMFSDEIPNPIALTTDFLIDTPVNDKIEEKSNKVIELIKNNLNENQFEMLYELLKELYVVRKNIFVNNLYMSHTFLKGSLKAKQSLLKSFENKRN
jgi:hypothetical protein